MTFTKNELECAKYDVPSHQIESVPYAPCQGNFVNVALITGQLVGSNGKILLPVIVAPKHVPFVAQVYMCITQHTSAHIVRGRCSTNDNNQKIKIK